MERFKVLEKETKTKVLITNVTFEEL